jgi:hypothetical protein
VFAPADPLLITYARSWSLSEPYLLRGRPPVADASGPGASPGNLPPLEAIDEEAGAVIRLRGPQLPEFLRRPA